MNSAIGAYRRDVIGEIAQMGRALFIAGYFSNFFMRNRLLSIIFLASCQVIGHAQEPDRIKSDIPFTADGKVEQRQTEFFGKTEVNKVESGSLNGVRYEFYYSDGSGTFSSGDGHKLDLNNERNWSVSCKKDPITDAKHCSMNLFDLYVFVYPKGRAVVSIGAEHYPGSTVAIRVDKRAPHTISADDDGNFSSPASREIIKHLISGKSVTTRYMKWPYRSWEDSTWDLYGFNETYKYISWAVERMK